jgi:hypothetical protein
VHGLDDGYRYAPSPSSSFPFLNSMNHHPVGQQSSSYNKSLEDNMKKNDDNINDNMIDNDFDDDSDDNDDDYDYQDTATMDDNIDDED